MRSFRGGFSRLIQFVTRPFTHFAEEPNEMRTFMSTLAIAAVAGGFIGGPAQASVIPAHPDLIINGGFEAPNLGASNYVYPQTLLDSWTFDGGAGIINASGPSAWYPDSPSPSGFAGNQYGFVQRTGTLSQSFNGGGNVNIRWLDAGRPFTPSYGNCCNGDQTYQVKLDGALLGTFNTVSGQKFTAESAFSANLGAGTHTLSFLGQVNADETAFLDQVSVTGVPELSTWAMMIIGFGGVGLQMRRRERTIALTA